MRPRGPGAAFSLVELLVAVVLIGVLTAGTVRVVAAGARTFAGVNDALAAQRTLRWALEQVADDLRMACLQFPPPGQRPTVVAASADPSLQSALMLVPDQPIKQAHGTAWAPLRAGADPHGLPDQRVDELSFVMDRPLGVDACLAAPIGGPEVPEGALLIRAQRELRLEPGDLLVVEDTPLEWVQVSATVELPGRVAEPVPVAPLGPGPGFRAAHREGCRVRFLRPLRVVRFAVLGLPLDGPEREARVPCLVRFETGYRADRVVPPWAALRSRAVILAEQVTGFRVDLSLDGRWPGVRGRDYADTVAQLEQAILERHGVPGAATDPERPFWCRRFPALLRIELEARAPLARVLEPGPDGLPVRRHRRDRLVLVVAPRNFGLQGRS